MVSGERSGDSLHEAITLEWEWGGGPEFVNYGSQFRVLLLPGCFSGIGI